ncbi:hypothetical protein ACJIZ3_010214 [Penstemon smallii]|uniref:Uncharacterized protein n=1 Tax=Penstemon smallii TaxID=265156 RepID=A0ABD3TG26_9LAMI
MGSSSVDESSQKELINEMLDVGNKLLMFRPSSVDDLLMLLEKVESILAKVWQHPPKSTGESLLPVMKALITDEILLHPEVNIQIAVACCMNELTRITAPQAPYPEDKMKVIFRLFVVALKQLSCESTSDYSIPLKILETVAKVKTCLFMMDVDSELIIEMFRLFLCSIKSDHPYDIFNYMEIIMTMVIEESDEISFELLEPLLASVRMDNKKISPVSWELGETVFENCATTLQPYLREAVKSKNLDLDDYAEIVISLCQITSNGENMAETEISRTVQFGQSKEKGSMENQYNELECSSTVRKKIVQTKTSDSPSTSKHTKNKFRKNLTQEKEKKPRRSLIDYKEEVVDSRIQVWWPMDKTFYTGTITAFDPVTKKHTIRYDDDEIENLNLKKERWKLYGDKQPQEKPISRKEDEADHPSPAKEPVQALEKTTKRKVFSSNKQQHASTSSKRSKSEECGLVKSGENSASDVINAIDELGEETHETNVSPQDGKNHTGQEE